MEEEGEQAHLRRETLTNVTHSETVADVNGSKRHLHIQNKVRGEGAGGGGGDGGTCRNNVDRIEAFDVKRRVKVAVGAIHTMSYTCLQPTPWT